MPPSRIVFAGSFGFPPTDAAGARVLGIGKALRAAGYEVEFGGAIPSGRPESQIEPGDLSYDGFAYSLEGCPPRKQVGILGRAKELKSATEATIRWIDGFSRVEIAAIIAYDPSTSLYLRLKKYAGLHGIALIVDHVEWPTGQNLPGGTLGLRNIDYEYRIRHHFRRNKHIIAISSFLADYYKQAGCHVIRIPPLVDLDDEKWNTPTRSDSDSLRLIYAGSPGNKDLLGTIISGVRLLPSGTRKVELHLVGVTEEEAQRLCGCSLTPVARSIARVICHGRLAQSEVPKMLSHADFTVLLRPDVKYAHAGFPTKIVESLSAGTPAIVNATSDIAKYIRDGQEGLIVKGYSAEALAATVAIAAGLSNESLQRMRTQARNRAREVFDYRRYCSELRRFLEACQPG